MEHIYFQEVIKQLEAKIETMRKDYFDDYKEGVVDGILIAIKMIEE